MFNKPNNTPDSTPNKGGSPAPQPEESHQPAAQPQGGYRPSSFETTSSTKPSVISEEVVLTGNIKTSGALHIEGTVIGDLNVSSLIVGPTGVFQGNVDCKAMNIRGKFTGTSDCQELVVASSAQIDAKITYRELTLQRGAILRGELHVASSKKD